MSSSEEIDMANKLNNDFRVRFASSLSAQGLSKDTIPDRLSHEQKKAVFKPLIQKFDPNRGYSVFDSVIYNNTVWSGNNGISYIPASSMTPDLNIKFWHDSIRSNNRPELVKVFKEIVNETSVIANSSSMRSVANSSSITPTVMTPTVMTPTVPNSSSMKAAVANTNIKPYTKSVPNSDMKAAVAKTNVKSNNSYAKSNNSDMEPAIEKKSYTKSNNSDEESSNNSDMEPAVEKKSYTKSNNSDMEPAVANTVGGSRKGSTRSKRKAVRKTKRKGYGRR